MGRNWAIVVGINHYENLRSLNFAKRDASVMAMWFQQEAKFEQVFLFTDDSPPIATNPPIPTQPTFGHLRRFLRAQFEDTLLKPEDNLWFFFAGHGNRYKDKDYLMFCDSDPGDIEHTAISVDYVTQRLRRSGADNVVLFLDACRDESSRSGLGIGEQTHQGVITFYSCTANQKSWEIDELQHGSFTHSLLEGLRLQGEANCATVERLAQYLSYQVPAINTRYGKETQNPYWQAEPPYKMYFILLEQTATLRDVEPLKYQASQAENRGDLSLAKQLWVRVLAVSRGDWEAIEAIERIALRQRGSFEPTITTIEPVTSSSGGRSISSEGETIRQKFLRWVGLGSAGLETEGTSKAFGLPLWTVEFETVTVDEKGQVIKRDSHKQAKFFKEDLGNGITLEMVSIPGGSFKMGSPSGEKGRSSSESPQHHVNVPAFFMGRFEVTQEQYQQVMGKNPSYFKGEKRPVEGVSCNDAAEFCTKLSQKTGRKYRLPSEAEWEYASRAGTTT
ncbi:peptidase C14, partial [Nostoc sp. T09]|uniref:SUMF1/EgtB/PvdO family nonheme iron enzyme n=1 Tax=Nostoc sp. T09 TaxID=1932621 RepID=UPI000A3825B2